MEVVRFSTHNIQNISNGGLDLALRGMYQLNVDLGLLQGAKINGGIYVQ